MPNVADLLAEEPISRSWWAHPRRHEIFAALNQLADSPEVVRLRLVRNKITFVVDGLWPALVHPSSRCDRRGAHRVGSASNGRDPLPGLGSSARDPRRRSTHNSRCTRPDAGAVLER
jgi:hypothetical protein